MEVNMIEGKENDSYREREMESGRHIITRP